MRLTEEEKAAFSALLLKEYGIELSRASEILPIIYLMHAYEEKMGSTIAAGFDFMDAAGKQLNASAERMEQLMTQTRESLDALAGQQTAVQSAPATTATGASVLVKVLLVLSVVQMLLIVVLLLR